MLSVRPGYYNTWALLHLSNKERVLEGRQYSNLVVTLIYHDNL